jgi:hypothetical protein
MADEKFDPAPPDKHAQPVKSDDRAKKARDELEQGSKDSFPASDPISPTQPAKSKP